MPGDPVNLIRNSIGRSRALSAGLPAILIVLLQLVIFPMPAGTWLQGAILGLLNALVALGLALIWRSNRILNFAQADMGTLPAVFAVGLITISGFNYFIGLAVGLGAAIAIGVLIDLLVIRRFRRSPRLTLTVATIGISQLLIVIALLAPRLWHQQVLTSVNQSKYRFPLHATLTIGQQVFHADDLVAAVVAAACLLGLSSFLRRSDTGIAVRAAAERSDRASLLGVPVQRMELVTWVFASVLSFIGVFLQGAILGFPLNASVGIAALVTALAALALGRFENLGAILASAVALGVLLQGVRWHNSVHPSFVYAVLGAVILVAMIAQSGGHQRADQEAGSSWLASLEPRALPRELRLRGLAAVASLVVLTVAVIVPISMSTAQQFNLATLVAVAIVALSIAVLTGWAGQITLGQMGFAALGASLGATATVTWHLDVTLGLIICALAGAVAGMIVGLPALRFRGLLPAATTLAFALAASGYLFDPNQFTWIPTGTVVPQRALGLWNISTPLGMYEFGLAVGVLCIIGLIGIRSSQLGRSIRASRDNDQPAQSYGISSNRARLTAYGIAGALASIGGFLLVHTSQNFDPATYAPQESLTIFSASVVGGVGSILGVLLGAFYLEGSRWLLTGYWQLLPTAVGVLVILLVFPGGFSSVLYRMRDRLAQRRADRLGITLFGPATEPLAASDTMTTGAPHASPKNPAPAEPAVQSESIDVILEARDIRVAYNGVEILFGVDLVVRRGEIVALMGTNGAGKSTLLRALCGTTPMTAGSVIFNDRDITNRPAAEVAGLGISQMPGGEGVFESLTVEENLRVAAWLQRHTPDVLSSRLSEQFARFPVLEARRREPAANLSGGQQQMLALAMALLNHPTLLLIDELSLGLSPLALDQLLDVIEELRDTGTTIVMVEQSMNVALRIADRACFMERGTMRFNGSTEELLRRPDIARAVYVQNVASVDPDMRSTPLPEGKAISGTVLALNDISVHLNGHTILNDVTFTVAQHEIVGIIGPNGAGKTTLFDVISGFTPTRYGSAELLGYDISDTRAFRRFEGGLGRSFQSSKLFASLTVTETLAVACNRWIRIPDPFSAGLRLPVRQLGEAHVGKRVPELIELLGLGNLQSHLVGELSTGQRRLVDIGCVLAHSPSLVLLDEPSSGVAQREAEALVPVISNLRDHLDASLVIIEHDMSIITELADRLVALDQGEVLVTGMPDDVLAHPQVVAAYLGQPARSEPPDSDAIAGGPTS